MFFCMDFGLLLLKPVFTNLNLWMLKETHNKAILSDIFRVSSLVHYQPLKFSEDACKNLTLVKVVGYLDNLQR